MSELDLTNIANASIATPASGVTALFVGTDKNLHLRDDTGQLTVLEDSSFQTLATAGGTTTFTNTSSGYTIFTGTSAQTVVLPDATTMVVGQCFQIDNDSTVAVTINANGGGAVWIVAPNGGNACVRLCSNSIPAGTWGVDYLGTLIGTGDSLIVPAGGGTAVVLAGTQSITGVKTLTNPTTAAGTITVPAMTLTSGTNLTSAAAGAVEYDGINTYLTNETSSGRGRVPIEQYFHLTAAGAGITTIANFFGTTSNISLVSGAYYDIEIVCFFTMGTTGSVITWTLTNSAAPTYMDLDYWMSPVTGIVAPPGTATMLMGQIVGGTTAAQTVATASLTLSTKQYARFKIQLQNSTGTSLKIQVAETTTTAPLVPNIGSFWRATRIPAGNVGTFAA